MKKTVFTRFVYYSVISVLLCLMFICGLLVFPVTGYIEQGKEQTIRQNAQDFSAYIGSFIGDDTESLTRSDLAILVSSLNALTKSLDCSVFVADPEGRLLYVSSTDKQHIVGQVLPKSVMSSISRDRYYEHGTLQDVFSRPCYIACAPVVSRLSGDTVAFCVIAQQTIWNSANAPSVFILFALIVLLAALLIFVFSSVYAYNATRPLKQMATAAKRFAVGDFESRVFVRNKDEIGELANAFNEMADSLASSEGLRRNFIANVSHELKTPMTTIAGYIDGILDGTIPPDEQEHYLGVVSSETKRLSRLVTSMISLSKIDGGDLKAVKKNFDILDTVFSVLQGFENEIETKKLAVEGLDTYDSVPVWGDRDLIHQVLYNLVENAVKFANQNGYLRFGFVSDDYRTAISVENSGPGIQGEDLKFVFDKFYKADKSRSTDKKSMGLGLYIARTIVRLHGGDISAQSEPEEYCRFSFWLPKEKPQSGKIKSLPDPDREDK